MIQPAIRRIMSVSAFTLIVSLSMAQDPGPKNKSTVTEKNETKPFRILTNGKRISIESKEDIKTIIAWSASGHRFVEQTNLNVPYWNFEIPTNEKLVFVMLELKNGKHYTEKIGVR